MRILVALLGTTVLVLAAPPACAHQDLLEQIERMDAQVAAEPGDPTPLIFRGDLYRRHGDFTAADADFQAARDLAPNDPELDFYQGRLALEAGDPATAGRLLDHYLAAHPDHPGAWRLRALSSQAQGDFAAAAAGFGQAVAFSQAPAPALYREWVLALTSTGDRAGALDAVDQGLDRLGTEVTLLGLGTDLALAENLPDRARSYLERLPAGLQTRSPWRQRYEELRCLETQASEVANCTAPAAQPDSGRITSNAQGLP